MPVERLHLFPTFESHWRLAAEVEAVDGVLDRHLGCEDLLKAPGMLEVTMAIVGLEEIPVARVLSDLDQRLHRGVRLGDVEFLHVDLRHACTPSVIGRTCPHSAARSRA
jgi:hypothetical protein